MQRLAYFISIHIHQEPAICKAVCWVLLELTEDDQKTVFALKELTIWLEIVRSQVSVTYSTM